MLKLHAAFVLEYIVQGDTDLTRFKNEYCGCSAEETAGLLFSFAVKEEVSKQIDKMKYTGIT